MADHNRVKGKRALDEESTHLGTHDSGNVEVSSLPLASGSSRGKKQKKLTSIYWDHFDLVCDEDGSKWASCIHCSHRLAIDTKRTGTNPLKRHLEHHCKNYVFEKGDNLEMGSMGEKRADGSCMIEAIKFNQERSKRDLAEAIILHEYPFSIVTHVLFRKFIHNLQPLFKFMSRQTIARECMRVYDDEAKVTYDSLRTNLSRVSITSDIWTSLQNFSYMVLTAHYIDSNWKLQKRILSFSKLESRHRGEDIASLVYEKCCHWNIERNLFSVVLDNCAANDVAIRELGDNLKARGFLLGNRKFLHVRCSTHILNLIVQDGLHSIDTSVEKIREGVKYIRASTQKSDGFRRHAEQLGAPNKKLVLDVSTRWNSTYHMLDVALEFKHVFTRYASIDKKFKYLPSDTEWASIEMITDCLALFHELTEAFSTTSSPTANMFFVKICELKEVLNAWCLEEGFIGSMATSMRTKFNKYWDSVSFVLAIASVLDPRFKWKSLEIYYPLLYEEALVSEKLKDVRTSLSNLIDEYASHVSTSKCFSDDFTPSQTSISSEVSPGYGRRGRRKVMTWQSRLKENIGESSSGKVKSEFDLYLEESLLYDVYDGTFNVLAWWRKNALKYPTLARIAKDILAIPISTVASESAFSTGGRVISQHRTSMTSKTVEKLICAQDWLRAKYEGSTNDEKDGELASIFAEDANDGALD